MENESVKIFRLEAFKEVQVKLDTSLNTVHVELLEGFAEIFGVEMIPNVLRTFSSSFAVLTRSGCTLKVIGTPSRMKTCTINSVIYDIHLELQDLREKAFERNEFGPIVLIVGPTDVGKSTLTRSLLNHAVRCNMHPLFIDLDVGQSSISVPGTLGILPIDCAGDVVKDNCDKHPFIYFLGHKSPGFNILHYFQLISKLGRTLYKHLAISSKVSCSGAIIDTCGWVTGQGYLSILHAAKSFQANTIFVLDDQKLYFSLRRDLPEFVAIKFLHRLDGATIRNKNFRTKRRNELIYEYFYGKDSPRNPHSLDINFPDIQIVRINCTANKIQERMYNEPLQYLEVEKVSIDAVQSNQVLAISYSNTVEQVITTSIVGFLLVKDVDFENKVLKVLSPQPAPLPNHILISGDIIYEEKKSSKTI